MRIHSRIKSLLTTFGLIAIVAVMLAMPTDAFAETTLRFKNGKSWRGDNGAIVQVEFKHFRTGKTQSLEGTIVEITKGKPGRRAITLQTTAAGRDAREIILEGDILSMTTVGQADIATTSGTGTDDVMTEVDSSGGSAAASGTEPLSAEKPGVFYLRWTGMVGTYARHDEMEKIAAEADKYGDNQIIVIHIESGGGMVIEGDKIHETLTELKKRHRVVAWVEKAISAAAYTAMHANEIYWHDEGTMGAIVMYSGDTAITGRRLAAWVKQCGDAAEESNLNRSIAEAMITRGEVCSYTKDPETGKVTIYDDLSGEVDLCDASNVLTLNKLQAIDVGYCMGVANTKEELAKHLGLPEWHEITDAGQKIYDRHTRTIDRAKEQTPRIMQDIQLSSTPQEQLRHMKRLLKHYEACGDIIMIVECRSPYGPKEELVRQMEALRKQIAAGR